MKPIRIVLADDHALMRAGIRTLCETLDGVTVVAEAADGNQALQAGAAGYLLKDGAAPELEMAITAVMRGEVYLCPQISKLVVQSYMQHAGAVDGPLGMLTPRQREILQLIAEGHSAKDIAFRLDLSVKTVETHRAQIMERLDIHDIAGLVRFAIRVGLVSSDK